MASYRRSVLFRLATDEPVRLWSGFGDLPIPAHAIEPSGATYVGAGLLLDVPSIKQLINGISDRVDFTVSGVSPETVRLALEDQPDVKGAVARIGFVNFDERWQVQGVPTWEWQGVADVLTTSREPSDLGGQRSITLSVAAADADRINPKLAWWTDADQRKRSPTDSFFSHVAGINAGTTRRWGPK